MEECGAFKSVYIMTENMCVAYSLILHASLVCKPLIIMGHDPCFWNQSVLLVYQEQKHHL
jgi:hypothetical protein